MSAQSTKGAAGSVASPAGDAGHDQRVADVLAKLRAATRSGMGPGAAARAAGFASADSKVTFTDPVTKERTVWKTVRNTNDDAADSVLAAASDCHEDVNVTVPSTEGKVLTKSYTAGAAAAAFAAAEIVGAAAASKHAAENVARRVK